MEPIPSRSRHPSLPDLDPVETATAELRELVRARLLWSWAFLTRCCAGCIAKRHPASKITFQLPAKGRVFPCIPVQYEERRYSLEGVGIPGSRGSWPYL